MSHPPVRPSHRVARSIYRGLLRAYPVGFREQFAVEMEETFLDRLRAAGARGPLAMAACLLRSYGDTLSSGLRERLDRRTISTPVTQPLARSGVFYWQDVRHAARMLLKTPTFTAMTVIVLGGGLGVSIFTFSFLHTAVFRPIPVDEGAGVIRIQQESSSRTSGIDAADLALMRTGLAAVTDLGGYTGRELIVGRDEGRWLLGAIATEWNLFSVTRTRPLLGRILRPDDQVPGAEPVIVLSHRAWQVGFGGDSAVIGSTAPMNGQPVRIVGVMPEGFGFPVAAEAWVPIEAAALTELVPGRSRLDVYGRLAPGITAEIAAAELTARLERARSTRPADPEDATERSVVTVRSFPWAQLGREGVLFVGILNALALMILLLACVNVTNLLLARANERIRETAVRLALGAPRARIVMQSMWESVILCVLGGVLATAISAWSLDLVNAWTHAKLEGNLAFWWVWSADRATLLAAGAFVTVAITVLGGVVATRAVRTRITAVLQDGAAGSGSRREGKLSRALVVTQVATVTILMFFGAMAGVLAHRVLAIDLGYDITRLAELPVALPPEQYPGGAQRAAFFERLGEELGRSPALEGSVLRNRMAELRGEAGRYEVRGRDGSAMPSKPSAFVQAVSGAIELIGAEVRSGRGFDGRDRRDGPRTALVSESLAAEQWPGESPVGREIRLVGIGEADWRTVVGVVRDVPIGDPLARIRSALAVYLPLSQTETTTASAIFRFRTTLVAAQADAQRAIAGIDPRVPPARVSSFDEIVAKSGQIAIGTTRLFGACFGFALVLAVTGIYGLMSRSIGQRNRELGVRRALGATEGAVLRLLLGQGARQLGIGVLLALPGAAAVAVFATRSLPIDPAVAFAALLLVAAVIGAFVMAATYLPARSAVAREVRDTLR